MPNYEQLLKRLNWYTGHEVEPEDAIMLFNMANEDISGPARYAEVKQASFIKDNPIIPLPADWIDVLEIKIKRPRDQGYVRIYPAGLMQPNDLHNDRWPYPELVGYELFGNYIEIRSDKPTDGELMIRYYATLPEIRDLQEVPRIPVRFHDLYALHAATKWFQNYQDELPTKNDFWTEFQQKLSDLDIYTLENREKAKSKQVYKMREWE